MTTEQLDAYSSERYAPLGLIANPFVLREPRDDESPHMALEVHKEANKLLVALEAMSSEERTRPMWVDRTIEINDYYNRAAESVAESVLIRDDALNYLPLYLQLFMARAGRIRSALHVLAERLATRDFDRTLAEWVRFVAAEEPDTELPAWGAVGDDAWQAFIHEFEADPISALSARFGECVMERERIIKPPPDIREVSLEAEPEEGEESPEEDAMTARTPDLADAVIAPKPPSEIEEDAEHEEMDGVAAYVIEYTKAHFSPVVARGLRAYVERGVGQLAQELKITQAPRKTFKKLVEFAALRFRKIVMLYDGLDGWNMVPEDLRIKLISAFTELRLLMGNDGIIVFLVPTGAAPELEDQFGGRDVVNWTFAGLLKLGDESDEIDPEVIDAWLAAATLPGATPMNSQDVAFVRLIEASDGSLQRFVELAGTAIDAAVDRGAGTVEETDAEAALAAPRN